jgi:hypothetical protein
MTAPVHVAFRDSDCAFRSIMNSGGLRSPLPVIPIISEMTMSSGRR